MLDRILDVFCFVFAVLSDDALDLGLVRDLVVEIILS